MVSPQSDAATGCRKERITVIASPTSGTTSTSTCAEDNHDDQMNRGAVTLNATIASRGRSGAATQTDQEMAALAVASAQRAASWRQRATACSGTRSAWGAPAASTAASRISVRAAMLDRRAALQLHAKHNTTAKATHTSCLGPEPSEMRATATSKGIATHAAPRAVHASAAGRVAERTRGKVYFLKRVSHSSSLPYAEHNTTAETAHTATSKGMASTQHHAPCMHQLRAVSRSAPGGRSTS